MNKGRTLIKTEFFENGAPVARNDLIPSPLWACKELQKKKMTSLKKCFYAYKKLISDKVFICFFFSIASSDLRSQR